MTEQTPRDDLVRTLTLAAEHGATPEDVADAIIAGGWARDIVVETPRRVKVPRPKHYRPEPGDEFIRLRDLGPEHKGRIFEARNQGTGEGVVGYIEDANHYLFGNGETGVVGLRFVGEPLGMFDIPDALILLKRPDYELPLGES